MKPLFAALALGLAAPLPAFAAPAGPVSAPMPAAAAPLDQLVALLMPQDALIALGAQAFESGYAAEIAGDAQSKALHARFPGLRAYVVAQLRPEFLRTMTGAIPALRQEIRAIVAQGLTAPEIADTLTFFASPTGAKVRAQVYATMRAQPGQSAQAMQAAALEAAMATMQPEDFPALMAFGASPAAQKMQTVNPRIAAASQAWSDRLVAQHRPRLRARADQAIRQYLAEQQ